MASSAVSPDILNALHNKATQLRIESVRATSEAGSGHPSSCCSAAEIVAALFFSVMRYDPKNPKAANSDRFVLSKGHAAPLLYAATGTGTITFLCIPATMILLRLKDKKVG